MVLLKQEKTSKLGAAELKKHLDELGDQLFNGSCTFTPRLSKAKDTKHKKALVSCFNHLLNSCLH